MENRMYCVDYKKFINISRKHWFSIVLFLFFSFSGAGDAPSRSIISPRINELTLIAHIQTLDDKVEPLLQIEKLFDFEDIVFIEKKLNKWKSLNITNRGIVAGSPYSKFLYNFIEGRLALYKNNVGSSIHFFQKSIKIIAENKNQLWPNKWQAEVYYFGGIAEKRKAKSYHLGLTQYFVSYTHSIEYLSLSLNFFEQLDFSLSKYKVLSNILELNNSLEIFLNEKKLNTQICKQAINVHRKFISLEQDYRTLDDQNEILEMQKKQFIWYYSCAQSGVFANADLFLSDLKKYLLTAIHENKRDYFLNGLMQLSEFSKSNKNHNSIIQFLNTLLNQNLSDFIQFEIKKQIAFYLLKNGEFLQSANLLQQIVENYPALSQNDYAVKLLSYYLYMQDNNFVFAAALWKPYLDQDEKNTVENIIGFINFSANSSPAYLYAISKFLNNQYQEAERAFRLIAESSQSTDDVKKNTIRIRSLLYLSLIYRDRNQIKESWQYIAQARKIFNQKTLPYIETEISSLEFIFYLLDENINFARRVYNRLKKDNAQDIWAEKQEWLIKFGEKFLSKKVSITDIWLSVNAFENYYNSRVPQGLLSITVPLSIYEKLLTGSLDKIYQTKESYELIVVLEKIRDLRIREPERNLFNSFANDNELKIEEQDKIHLARQKDFDFFQAVSNYYLYLLNNQQSVNNAKSIRQYRNQIVRLRKKIATFFIPDKLQKSLSLDVQLKNKALQLSEKNTGNKSFILFYYPVVGNKLYPLLISNQAKRSLIKLTKESLSYKTIQEKVLLFLISISDNNRQDYEQRGYELISRLLGDKSDMIQSLNVASAAIVADYEMASLPFVALPMSDKRFLVEKFAFFYGHFVDHILTNGNNNIRWDFAALHSPMMKGSGFDFVSSKTEVELIQGLFEKKEILTEEDLKPEQIKAILSEKNIWHISLPLFIQPNNPYNFLLLLSQNEQKNYTMPLTYLLSLPNTKRSFVFFSNTFFWKNSDKHDLQKEQVALDAIVRRLDFTFSIYSMEPIHTDSAILISSFYHKLRRISPEEAMRQAQVRVMQRNRHPYYWSRYLLYY